MSRKMTVGDLERKLKKFKDKKAFVVIDLNNDGWWNVEDIEAEVDDNGKVIANIISSNEA